MLKKHITRTLAILSVILLVCVSLPMSAIAATINPPADGNFTLLWVTDPQWYTFAYQDVLKNQNQWVVDNYDRMDMRYIFHTGDFVDLPHATDQWDYASSQYKLWDNAGLAYGILAGNHDVDGSDHTEFSQYFGKSRYDQNPWYGGDYDNHFGHYDLMTIDGVKFVFVYMGYGTRTQAEYDWMNSVLSTYSDRIAVLSFHEYLAASGERTATGEAIFQNVVLKNPNVRMVLCGHNYNSTRKVQEIDDNGDGKADRTVYQMMANYQNTTRGGNGFMRFMECDVKNGTIIHRTWSSYTQSFGSDYEDGTVIDEYGYRDEFITPFDFSAPTPKESGDPEKGSVVVSPKVTFALDGSSAAAMFSVNNHSVRVLDRNFSLNATDAFDSLSDVTFVTTKYSSSGSHRIASVTKGSSLSANAYVPVPQDGVVIALKNNAMDEMGNALNINQLTIGRKVYIQGLATPPGVKSIHLNVPSLNTTFNISAINRLTGNNEWNLYDSLVGNEAVSSSETHTWDMLFGFTPKGGNAYTLTALNTTLGEAKTMTIPQNGFVLSVNTFGGQDALRDALRAKFVKGLEVMLNGHTPGTEPVFDLTNLLPSSASGWNYDSTQMQVTDTNGAHTFYKTSGQWPAADIDFPSPITFDPAETAFYYDLTMETGSKSNIILFFKNSNSVSSTSAEYISIQSYFKDVVISSGSGDIKGDDIAHSGKVDFSTVSFPSGCYNTDGTLTLNGIRIYASGEVDKKMYVRSFGLTDNTVTDIPSVPQSVTLLDPDTITVSDPSKPGSYEYINGVLTVTANTSAGYEIVMIPNREFHIETMQNWVLGAESTAPFDVQLAMTTAADDATYGLVSDFNPFLCGGNTVNGCLPAGIYNKSMNLYSCFTYNGVAPSHGWTTVKSVRIKLGGQGTLTLNALQSSNKTAAGYFADDKTVKSAPSAISGSLSIDANDVLDTVEVGTSASALIGMMNDSEYLRIVDKNNSVVSGNVATGMRLQLVVDGNVYDEADIAVRGDTNGDGGAKTDDARSILLMSVDASAFTAAQRRAADYSGDGSGNSTDVRQILAASVLL